jgi:hypothetical protein
MVVVALSCADVRPGLPGGSGGRPRAATMATWASTGTAKHGYARWSPGVCAAKFCLPITTYTTSYFLTARMAARRMVANKSGVIMRVTTLQSRMSLPQGAATAGDGRHGGTHSKSLLTMGSLDD